MSANSYKTALDKLLQAQKALDDQDISTMPADQAASLERSKSAIYQEIQAVQAQAISRRDDAYKIETTAFAGAKSDLESLSKWVSARAKLESELFSVLTKGLSVALSLFF